MAALNSSIERSEGSFEGTGKLKLYTQNWKNKAARNRAVLIILHGLKDHSSRYAELAQGAVAKGFFVYAYDVRGHGRSEGRRAYVNKFDDLISDLEIFVKSVRQQNPNSPIFIFAHSMGGTTVTLSIINHRIEFQGVVLSAPALIPGESISPLLIKLTGFLGKVAPQLPLMNLPNRNFSRDPAVVAAMSSDPLILQKNGPVRTAAQLLDAMRQVQLNMESFSAPLLALHGTADKLTNPAGSRKLSERASVKDKTLKLYPGLVHDLVHEPEKSQVISDIIGWLESHS